MKLGNYHVDFDHNRDHNYTQCTISTTDGVTVSSSIAKVHPNDAFCKAKGRKIALSKALITKGKTQSTNVRHVSRSDSTAIWTDYIVKCKLM